MQKNKIIPPKKNSTTLQERLEQALKDLTSLRN